MSRREAPMAALEAYLPADTYPAVLDYLQQFKVHLTVARERKSILGDYRHRTHGQNHRISVNGNLNKYSFLITLLHELAHLLTYEHYGNRVMSHGREWKKIYGQLLAQFLEKKVFPADIEAELQRSLHNPGATTCAEDQLLRVLRKYDPQQNGRMLIEELPASAIFQTDDGRIFRKQEKLRKRYRGTEIKTGRIYLFSPIYEVKLLASE